MAEIPTATWIILQCLFLFVWHHMHMFSWLCRVAATVFCAFCDRGCLVLLVTDFDIILDGAHCPVHSSFKLPKIHRPATTNGQHLSHLHAPSVL
jgi:hypothetical protein